MKDRKYLVLPILFGIILLGGCATYPTPYGGMSYGFNPNAVTGAVTGAALGTVAGAVAGDPGAGAAIGGVVGHCRDLGQGRIRLRHFLHHPRTTVPHPSTMVHLHRCITIPIIHATTVTAVGNWGDGRLRRAREGGRETDKAPRLRTPLNILSFGTPHAGESACTTEFWPLR
jgi:Glycine-zipper domain